MEKESLLAQANQILKQRNLALAIGGVLLVANLFLSAAALFSDKEVVLVPNSLDKESSITNGKMSPAYLEAITRDVVNLMLNVTPASAEYSSKAVIKITHPAFYGQLKKDLNERNKDVIGRRISTFFSPQSMVVNETFTGAIITGKLSTYLGKEEVLTEDKIYSITYGFEGFRPLVIDFHEVDKDKSETQGGRNE
jgi:conjugal transfer pilus assembly protein TraE